MTDKQKIINALKELDFLTLDNLLDNNKSYMDVSKSTFLNALRKEIERHEDLKRYELVEEGICDHCNKGCKAYKFKAENCPSLNLFFEEKNGMVTDIYLCNALKVENPDENDWDIYFRFYEEEKVDFKPTIEYSIKLQRIDRAIEQFNKLPDIGLIPVQDVLNWFNKMKQLANELGLKDPFKRKNYKAFLEIDKLYSEVSHLQHNYEKNELAEKALIAYNEIEQNDEKSIIMWLLENKDNYFFSLKKTENWEKTGILILETEPNLVVDCSDCIESFIFDEIQYKRFNEIMTKYKPTKEHYEQNGGRVSYDLETFLKLHDKYLELF